MQNQIKVATPEHPVHALIADRWSPYAFNRREVERDKLLSCLEAARWAASSYNEQPWSFIIATRDNPTAFATMLECLLEANQTWAAHAGVLMLTVASRSFARNGKPNRMAEHDVGLAVANLTVQATSLGLHVHQMAGINPSKARQTYAIPESHDALTAVAIGYAADPQGESPLAERDRTPRTRKPLGEFVFTGVWGTPGV